TERPLEVDDDDVGLTDVVPIRVGAFDLAGNFSGWQRLDPLHLPDGCGCTSGPSRPPLGLLVLLVLAVRRRGRAAPP
ncbi:MAG: hypothetical protein KDK70_20180, partial [Myxococcales bacterium]|nr:hypothetical protein [Myxococcales bacterium]